MSFKTGTERKKPDLFRLCVTVLLSAVLILQAVFIIISNLALLKEHICFDSSWALLKSVLISRDHTLFSSAWAEQTGLYLDSAVLPASLLYGITGNIFLSYGISNILIFSLIVYLFYSITKSLGCPRIVTLITLGLVLCPYLLSETSDLGYFSTVVTGAGFYAGRCCVFLMIIKSFIDIKEKNRFTVLSLISVPLCVLSGISVGFFLLLILIIPCMICIYVECLGKNGLSPLKNKEAVYVYLCALGVILGKLICKFVIKAEMIDDTRTWTAIPDVWNNFCSVIKGFFKLTGSLPLGDSVRIDLKSVVFVFPLFILAAVICAFVCVSVKLVKNPKEADIKVIIFPITAAFNVLLFSLFNVNYGGNIFEERYLICAYFALVLTLAYHLTKSDYSKLFTRTVILGLTVSVLITTAVSDKRYTERGNGYLKADEIVEAVKETDCGLVYVWFTDNNAIRNIGRILRVYDLDTVYKCYTGDGFYHWGDYFYYENNADYTGKTLMITEKADVLPEELSNVYTLYKELDNVYIYISETNPLGD